MTVNVIATGFNESAASDKFQSVLKLSIKEVAEKAGFRNALDLSKRAGLPYESVRRLWQGTASMVSLGTLERLCQTLEVRPAQLFDYDPETLSPLENKREVKDGQDKKQRKRPI